MEPLPIHEHQTQNPTTVIEEDEVMNYQSVNPYDGKPLKTFEAHSDAQLERATETASACFEKWRHTSRF